MLLLSDAVPIFWSSIVILTSNGRFLDCVAVEFSERYIVHLNVTTYARRMQSAVTNALSDTWPIARCHYSTQCATGKILIEFYLLLFSLMNSVTIEQAFSTPTGIGRIVVVID
jgi:hypothetical protein